MHKKLLITLLTVSVLGMSGCSNDVHEHTFDEKWETNETDHWHKATCKHTELTKDLGAHVDINLDGKCDACLCDYHEHMHTFKESWSYDNDNHWHDATCEHKDLTQDFEAHIDEDGDHICDVCKFRHPDALAITKQPGIVYANYPDSAVMSVEVNDLSKVYYCQWQYLVGTDYEGKPRYKDLEGGAGYNTLTLEIPSIRQRAGDYLVFRCEFGDDTGATLFSEPGQFVVINKTEDIDCAYFGEYAIKAGETLDLLDTPYGEGTISLNEDGNVYTFTNVNASYKYPMVSHGIFDNFFVIDSDTNTHEEITINLVGDNVLNNPYWDAAYNAGQDVIFTFFGSKAVQAKIIINGSGNLTLKGGSRLIACYSKLEIDADIDLEGFHYRLSNGISCDDDIVIKSGSHITGSVGGYGISASGIAKLTIEDNAVVDLDIFPGKVMSGPTSIYGLSSSDVLKIGKATIDVSFHVDTNVYSIDGDMVGVSGLISHNTQVLLNGSDVNIKIETTNEPLKDFIYVDSVYGIHSPFVGLDNAKLDIDIDAKDCDRLYGICSQATQILSSSDVSIDSVGGLESYGIFSNTKEEKDGVKVLNSNVSINMKYAQDIVEKAKVCLFGIATMLYYITLNEDSTVSINSNGEGAAFAVITVTSSSEPANPTAGYEATSLIENGFVAQESHSVNVASFKPSNKYVIYETFVDTSSLAPLSKVTLVSSIE